MAANTICLYAKVASKVLKTEEFRQKVVELGSIFLGESSKSQTEIDTGDGGNLYIFTNSAGGHAVLRVYTTGLVTADIQYFITDFKQSHGMADLEVNSIYALGNRKLQLSEELIRALEQKVKDTLGDMCLECNSLYAPIRRGQSLWPYMVTADERLIETDFEEMVCEVNSQYQNIRIFKSTELGNMLYLDGDAMLGESDLIYTQTLCCIGDLSYTDKEVLILGGGDGGILYELLKEKPKMIIMAEIDVEVIKACRTHMRSVCGDAMDNLTGPNHKILIEDCVKVLHESIQNNTQYDYVINDLTEFPVDKAIKGYGYDFETTSLISELSLKALKPGGKLLARGNCASAHDYRTKLENDIKKMGCDFKRREVYVPSFRESYCLYEIWHVTTPS